MSGPLIEFLYNQKSLHQLIATLIAYLIIRTILYLRVRSKRYGLFEYYNIPGPKTNLFNGNFDSYMSEAFFEVDVKFRRKFGSIFRVFVGDEPILVATDLKVLQRVFLDNQHCFKDRLKLHFETPNSKGILFASHHRWEVFRRIMSPTFSSYKLRGDKSMQFVEDSVKLLLDYIESKFHANNANKIELDVLDLIKSATLHIISHMAINLPKVEVKEREEHVKALDDFLLQAGDRTVNLAIRFPLLRSTIQFVANNFGYAKALKLITTSLNKTIDSRLKLLDHYSSNVEKKPLDGRLLDTLIRMLHECKMDRDEVSANCFNILIAGYDTTATTLTYILWALARHQEAQSKLRVELMTYGTGSPYLDQVIDETMRLWPTVINFTSRIAAQTVQVNNKLIIPKGTRVIYNTWLMHRDEQIWGPDVLEFKPERFSTKQARHPCAFAPFGLGQHKCIGLQLARLEMKMIICDMLLRYKIRVIAPEILKLKADALFLTKPSHRVVLNYERLQT